MNNKQNETAKLPNQTMLPTLANVPLYFVLFLLFSYVLLYTPTFLKSPGDRNATLEFKI